MLCNFQIQNKILREMGFYPLQISFFKDLLMIEQNTSISLKMFIIFFLFKADLSEEENVLKALLEGEFLQDTCSCTAASCVCCKTVTMHSMTKNGMNMKIKG